MNSGPDLDVAISFLNTDLGLAMDLRERLGTSFDVFVYAAKQQELAGTDGLESFRAAFRHRARLVVILHRDGWGSTPWTRVEQEAITDRFLKEGAGFLFVIMLDESPPPPWLPDRLIRFSLKDFGVEQAVGAIKARALEQGSSMHRPSTAQLAEQAQEAIRFQKQRSALLKSTQGVESARAESQKLIQLLSAKAEELTRAAADLGIEHGSDAQVIVLRTRTVALHLFYQARYTNVLDESVLIVREFHGATILPGQRGFYIQEPKELNRKEFAPDLSQAYGWCWKDRGGEVLTSEQVADGCVSQFLALVQRQAAGELPDLW